jgi:hypothetical protein
MQRATLRAGILAGLFALLFSCLPATSADVAPGVDQNAVARAIERGVVYLKANQEKNGGWSYYIGAGEARLGGLMAKVQAETNTARDLGVTALAGLALLEADVKPNDPAVQKAAEHLRQGLPDLNYTHSLAAAVLFLDRLNDPRDAERIRTLGARLAAGQLLDGGWSYGCPKLAEADVRKLNYISEALYWQGLAKVIKQANAAQGGGVNFSYSSACEQSCSEFAIQGLWVARRHQVPVATVMTNYEKMCRANQHPDGSFPYGHRSGVFTIMPGYSSPVMTGAGLLGLLTCHGSANEVALLKYAKSKAGAPPAPGKGLRDLAKDKATAQGFAALERMIAYDIQPPDPKQKPAAGASGTGAWANVNHFAPNGPYVYMSLWSVERVAVAYDQEKIGKIDWYEWGARKLLKWQSQDGGWTRETGMKTPHLDTAFALLFLRRAQPVPDLYPILKGVLPVPREPSSSSSSSAESKH